MRYHIQPATSVDVAFLAAVIEESHGNRASDGASPPIQRLLQTCASSSQVWAARDPNGQPTALWGVTPVSDDPDTGHLWMLACEAFDDEPSDLESLSRLVFLEMLGEFDRLENFVDTRKVRAIQLLRAIGFTVDPAKPRGAEEGSFHRVWIDSDRLVGARPCSLPN